MLNKDGAFTSYDKNGIGHENQLGDTLDWVQVKDSRIIIE